ncbi:hypothetical protein [Halomonas huangheensis]|uniref:Uncharacterized protein n=1 Tax=Halomonas huangheensis TaxID=1178482 RepID=W1N6H4_9GAMM|nr:hypothetical protein [Halomonas huangheensis]ALM54201.1 hypothetical protein AR456_19450 [Halomonas huangheensis]ERL51114.1 hypothetical protein BJB45_19275 [Halomonas huangheensis]
MTVTSQLRRYRLTSLALSVTLALAAISLVALWPTGQHTLLLLSLTLPCLATWQSTGSSSTAEKHRYSGLAETINHLTLAGLGTFIVLQLLH